MCWHLYLRGTGALVAPIWTPGSCSQVCLWSRLLLHGRALSGHAGARQHSGPDHWRHRWYGLLDLHHHLHASQKIEAVTCLLTSARLKKFLLYSHLCSCAEYSLGWVLSPWFDQASEDQDLQPPVWLVWFFCPQPSHNSVTLLCALNISTVSVTALTAFLCKSLV